MNVQEINRILGNINTKINQYLTFSVTHVRSLEHKIFAKTILLIYNNAHKKSETKAAEILLILASMMQADEASRLCSLLSTDFSELSPCVNNLACLTTLIAYTQSAFVVTDEISLFIKHKPFSISFSLDLLVYMRGKINPDNLTVERGRTLAGLVLDIAGPELKKQFSGQPNQATVINPGFISSLEFCVVLEKICGDPRDAQKLYHLTKQALFHLDSLLIQSAANTILLRNRQASDALCRITGIPLHLHKYNSWPDHISKLRSLGRGTFGQAILYQNNRDRSPQEFVLKMLHGHMNVPPYTSLFLDELKLTCRIPNHKNILAAHPELCFHHKKYYLGLAYANDGGLNDFLINHDQTTFGKCSLQIAIGITEGLLFLQQLMIYHGDLSLQNILLADSIPKIADFGKSIRFRNEGEKHAITVGCVEYIMPYYAEKILLSGRGAGGVRFKITRQEAFLVDTYAVVVILWMLATKDSLYVRAEKALENDVGDKRTFCEKKILSYIEGSRYLQFSDVPVHNPFSIVTQFFYCPPKKSYPTLSDVHNNLLANQRQLN